jgi:hypothetical protein
MLIEPFRINEIDVASGARLGICRLPGRSGDLAGDMKSLVQWRPALVVSMTETVEMQEMGAAGLIEALTVAGIAHAHFPIRDFGVPENPDIRWPPLSRQLQDVLDQGQGLLLHCLGGKGRSGMVAMRLLTERGMPPAEALAVVRAAKAGAVETDAQAAWGADG